MTAERIMMYCRRSPPKRPNTADENQTILFKGHVGDAQKSAPVFPKAALQIHRLFPKMIV